MFATICPLKNLPNFRHFDDVVLNRRFKDKHEGQGEGPKLCSNCNVITGCKTYVAAASTRRESKSVKCQTSLTWVFSDRPLRTTESNVRSSGGPGSVSTGTQASSGK